METSLEVRKKTKSGVERKKIGRPLKVVSEESQKKILLGLKLGMPIERLVPLAGFSGVAGGWLAWLDRNPSFRDKMEEARSAGELELVQRVHGSESGWQGSAWLLERARGYVARAGIEHTGKGGSQLTIAHQVMDAIGEREKGS